MAPGKKEKGKGRDREHVGHRGVTKKKRYAFHRGVIKLVCAPETKQKGCVCHRGVKRRRCVPQWCDKTCVCHRGATTTIVSLGAASKGMRAAEVCQNR